jgi:hypothetical protein
MAAQTTKTPSEILLKEEMGYKFQINKSKSCVCTVRIIHGGITS